MNPSLPGGATATDEQLPDGTWVVGGRLGYTFVPYRDLQVGSDVVVNQDQLAINVHLITLQARATAPSATTLDLQLPTGVLEVASLVGSRTDSGIGDLEVRVRQSSTRWRPAARTELGGTLGLVLPTGPYVARAGAANLSPEANYLTLGRGVTWGLAELDLRHALSPRASLLAQLSGRVPVGQAGDGFSWGNEGRVTVGASFAASPRASLQLTADLQWRGGASEPDPFNPGERLVTANAGGTAFTVTPSVSIALPRRLALGVGMRVPTYDDVTGRQLVPSIGGFVSLSVRQPIESSTPRATATRDRITVIDYWATWCAPCEEISARLDDARDRWGDEVDIKKVDMSAWPRRGELPEGAEGLPVVEIYDAAGERVDLLLDKECLDVVDIVDDLRRRRARD